MALSPKWLKFLVCFFAGAVTTLLLLSTPLLTSALLPNPRPVNLSQRCLKKPPATLQHTYGQSGNEVHNQPVNLVDSTSNSTDALFLAPYRQPDVVDTFATYSHRGNPACEISSAHLHRPFSPLCRSRADFLTAYTGGGRIGFDAPFMPRGCDMRWFTTEEACEIFARFERVIVIGDSMMRHTVGALNVFLRKDLGYGAVTGWNFGEDELRNCFCAHQMDVKSCSVQGVYRTSDVLKHDPDSFACPKRTVNNRDGSTTVTSDVDLVIELMLKYPLDPTELGRLKDLLSSSKPKKPYAFIFGHGLWNDLDLQATMNWIDGIMETIYSKAPYLKPTVLPQRNQTSSNDHQPWSDTLFITPNAAGTKKPDQFVITQGEKSLQIFEKAAAQVIAQTYGGRIEHLGTWNMSIQTEKWDGVHLDLTGNLVKAMGVLNWLSLVDVERWPHTW